MTAFLLALAVPVSALALLHARWEYRKRGRLSILGLLLLCVMIFVPNLALDYAMSFEMPDTPLDYVGIVVVVAGTAICIAAMASFRSISKVLCVDRGELTITGLYRWSRNPQYVGFMLFLFGFALTDWSAWCLAALLVQAVNLHLLVLIEEEHLRRSFGEPYLELCRSVPRYATWGRLRI